MGRFARGKPKKKKHRAVGTEERTPFAAGASIWNKEKTIKKNESGNKVRKKSPRGREGGLD